MAKYLLKTTNVYRVPTVDDALRLREELDKDTQGELVSFTYTTKFIKQKGEIVEEYQVVKATLEFNSEKEPESFIDVSYGEII